MEPKINQTTLKCSIPDCGGKIMQKKTYIQTKAPMRIQIGSTLEDNGYHHYDHYCNKCNVMFMLDPKEMKLVEE